MTQPQVIVFVGYAAAVVLTNYLIGAAPGGRKALLYAVSTPLEAGTFVYLIWFVAGEVSLVLAVAVVIAATLNLVRARFCANCGTPRGRQSAFDTDDECPECRGKVYVGVWRALDIPEQPRHRP